MIFCLFRFVRLLCSGQPSVIRTVSARLVCLQLRPQPSRDPFGTLPRPDNGIDVSYSSLSPFHRRRALVDLPFSKMIRFKSSAEASNERTRSDPFPSSAPDVLGTATGETLHSALLLLS
jgi:hypothetical protein